MDNNGDNDLADGRVRRRIQRRLQHARTAAKDLRAAFFQLSIDGGPYGVQRVEERATAFAEALGAVLRPCTDDGGSGDGDTE
jgi:hypothetical protein